MVQSNARKSIIYHSSTRVEDGMQIHGMKLYIEERDIYGTSSNPHDDDDLSSIGNSIHRYVDSGISFLEDVDGKKEKMSVLGLSEKHVIRVSVSQDSTAELDGSLIQAAPPGSQPDPSRNDGDVSKGWYISHSICLPRWIQRAPTWLQVLVLGSLMLLIVSIVVAGIALSEMNTDSSQSNPNFGRLGATPTPSPITMGQTNAFSPTVIFQDQINESQPTSSPSLPLESVPNNIFSPANTSQDQIAEPPQLRDPLVSSESGASVLANATTAEDYLVEPPTSAPTTHPTEFPSAQHVDTTTAPSSPPAPQIRSTELPSAQTVDASPAPSSPPTPTFRSTQLPSAQLAAASSALPSPTTSSFSSGGKRYKFFQPST